MEKQKLYSPASVHFVVFGMPRPPRGQKMTDIIERLDERRRKETEITELELLLLDAADEIEKLRARLRQPQDTKND